MPAKKTTKKTTARGMGAVLDVQEKDVTLLTDRPDIEPNWDRARGLYTELRKSAQTIISLGEEIRALHDQHYAQGARNDKSILTVLTGTQAVKQHLAKGWREKVKDELGISHKTAIRLMDKALCVAALQMLIIGEDVEFDDTRGNVSYITATTQMQEMAKNVFPDVLAGTVNASRAWAGVIGEGTRREGGFNRAPVNYVRNICQAVTSFKTTFKHWDDLDTEQRHEVEDEWNTVLGLIPSEWKTK